MIKSKKTLLGIFLIIALMLSGCAANPPASGPDDAGPAADAETAAPDDGFRTVTDALGRQVEVPKNVETIAALSSAARNIAYAGCADKLVGVTDLNKDNSARMPFTVVYADHFASIASSGSGGPNDTPYIEELIALSPDVIFTTSWDEKNILNVQDKTGIPTISIASDGIFDDTFYFAMELIGEVMGLEERCTEIVQYVKAAEADLGARTKDIPDAEKPTVYTGAVSFAGAHGFEGTHAKYPPFMAINAKNVVDELEITGKLQFLVDFEKVLEWDPDIIFLNPANMSLVHEDYKTNKSFYDSLKAVQSGDVYSQIAYICNGVNIELAIADAYYAGKVIYPQQFSDIDIIAKTDEVCTFMLGQPFYNVLEADGLSFGKIVIGE